MAKILVLGGTRFFGKKLVQRLLNEGHDVTIATHGQAPNPFGDRVVQLKFDRSDSDAFAQAVAGRSWDIVYDNICYSPDEAKAVCEILNGHIQKLVFTSTMSTYNPSEGARTEADFNPSAYGIRMGTRDDFTYGEAKRQAEAVFYKYAQFPVVAVRFPIVVGEDDYTKRLLFHVQHVLNNEAMAFVNMDARMSYITSDEAAQFLHWAAQHAQPEPYNATATGTYTLAEFIELIEQATQQRAKIALGGDDKTRSPYAVGSDWYMDNAKATKAGFTFSVLSEWLPQLIAQLVRAERANK